MKNVYITWHYTTHGVAYFKHILSEFYRQGLPNKSIYFDNLNQEELNAVFDNPNKDGFVFDEVIYLTAPQIAFDKLSTRRFNYTRNVLQDPEVVRLELTDIYEQIINENTVFDKMEKELDFVKHNYPDRFNDFKSTIWRNIQHYPIEQQIRWLTEMSNFSNVRQQAKFKRVDLLVTDLRNEKQIADEVSKWAKRYFAKQKQDTQFFINVSLGSSETQVVWHILSESGLFPKNTHFLKTYDDKTKSAETLHFKLFSIKEIPVKLISEIGSSFKLFTETKSPPRKLAALKMKTFLSSGFSILLMGERGIGKTKMAKETSERDEHFITANCASFPDDTMAESELFGYVKGAFTGGLREGKSGLIVEANGGILFLDEIHNLSKSVQAKLMTAFQTEKGGKMKIRPLGATKRSEIKEINCKLIFATNRKIEELQECLLSDFYDRIVQHVVEIPPLRESKEERESDFASTWEYLFSGLHPTPSTPTKTTDPDLFAWLIEQDLSGNWRDLEKIAMYYNAFNQFRDTTKGLLKEKTAYQYAKTEFEKYHSVAPTSKGIEFEIVPEKTATEMLSDFQFQLQEWAVKKYGSRKEAAERLGVTEKSLNNWKNRT
jgi:transcriptional regulator with AAA-type ATPase domain